MDEQKSDTITIKKESLWKYSTIFLLVILIVGAVVYFQKGNDTTGNVVNVPSNNNQNNGNGNLPAQTAGDLSSFSDDTTLYPAIGPTDAKVTVIEFSDFQCPFCAIAAGYSDFAKQYSTGQYADLFSSADKVEQLARDGKIRFIYVPMTFLGDESELAANAALCANEQGKFFEMHKALFAAHDGQENNGKFTNDKLKQIAKTVSGLDQEKIGQCIDSNKYSSSLLQVNQDANNAGVQGTPTFFVNGVQSSGSWSEISGKLKSAGVTI